MLGLEREQHSFEFNIINQNKIDMYLSAFGAYDSLSKLFKTWVPYPLVTN